MVRVANKYLGPDNYAAIYKLQGEDTSIVKMPKPELTPIATNRDKSSAFLREIQNSTVNPIEPVFLDFDKDITVLKAKQDIPVLYTKNTTNDISTLIYVFETGSHHDKRLSLASGYFDLIGTADKTYDEIQAELYKLACSVNFSIGGTRSFFVISGLSENLPKAAEIFEDWLANAKADKEIYARYADQILQSRANQKTNQSANFSRLRQYVQYGPKMAKELNYSNEELASLDPQQFIDAMRDLAAHEQQVIYYGNMDENQVLDLINNVHNTPAQLKPVPTEQAYPAVNPEDTIIFIAPYNAKQLYMTMFANMGGEFDVNRSPITDMYNEYFGGSMNSIVFQEMRESRSLAYSAGAYLLEPSQLKRPYTYVTTIATQNDKLNNAVNAFLLIINEMPESADAFDIAKQALDARLRSERVIKDNKAWAYMDAKRKGLNKEERQTVYENIGKLTLADVIKFQKDNIKGRTYYYGILGDPKDLDLEALKKHGRIVMLTTEDIFGY